MKIYLLFQVCLLNFVITINAMDLKKKTEELESRLGVVELLHKQSLQIIIKNPTQFNFFMMVKDQNNKDLVDVKDSHGTLKKSYQTVQRGMQISTVIPIKDCTWPITVELVLGGTIIKKVFEAQEAKQEFTIIANNLKDYADPSFERDMYRFGLKNDETQQIVWHDLIKHSYYN